MLRKDVVSIISPCYNGELYVEDFLESVLEQDYPAVEVILVDDGSTDATSMIVNSYIEKFKTKGYQLFYIFKENGGQSTAINLGLLHVHGEYVMWMDSDDVFLPHALSEKINYLKNNPQIGFAICQGYEIDGRDHSIIKKQIRIHDNREDNLFKDLIDCNNVIFTPAAYIVRTQVLFDVIPLKQIFESREGQNWQLLLPLAYAVQYGYIDVPLYMYTVRSESHSHTHRSYRDQIQRFEGFRELQKQTITRIPGMVLSEKTRWMSYIDRVIDKKEIKLALERNQMSDWKRLYTKNLSLIDKIKYNPICYYIWKKLKK